MNKDLSIKLYNLNIFCMIFVVVLHAQNVSNRINGFVPPAWDYYLQHTISGGIASASVPLFLIISGFLFFDDTLMTAAQFKTKISKRLKTLLIPYLLVSLFGILLFVLLQTLPFTSKYFNNEPILNKDIDDIIYTWLLAPVNYQLWFLRNLFCAVLISPLIYIYLKYLKHAGIILLGIVWLCFADIVLYHIMPTLFFFTLGGYLKMYRLAEVGTARKRPLLLIFIVWGAFIAAAFLSDHEMLKMLFVNLYTITGVLAVWQVMDVEYVKSLMNTSLVNFLKGFSFFLFLFHEPLLTILIKIAFALFNKSGLTSIITYFASIMISISVCVIVGFLLKKYIYSLYSVVTGSR